MNRPPASRGSILRDIDQATTRMKKSRRFISELRNSSSKESDWEKACEISLDALTLAGMVVSKLSIDIADSDLLLKVIHMQRYATSLLVRVRRIKTALSSPEGISKLNQSGFDSDHFELDGDDE